MPGTSNVSLTVHDFNTERRTLMVLGGYLLAEGRTVWRLANLLYLGVVTLVYCYLICVAVLTIFITPHKEIAVQALQTLCLLLVGFALPGSKQINDRNLQNALHMLYRGVHVYTGEVIRFIVIGNRPRLM